MKREIKVLKYTDEIMKELKKGILLTSKNGEKVNCMAISWGSLGIEWSRPIFTIYVKESRFTHHQLEENPEFTINIPVGNRDKRIIELCGKESGRDIDKIEKLGLTLESPKEISVPGIKELPLTLECKIIYKHMQVEDSLSEEIKDNYYTDKVDGYEHGKYSNYHTAYCGQIVSAYIIE